METQTRVGPRVLIPPSFPASQRFLEMRILGSFPSNTVFAVLYAYIESLFSFRSVAAKTCLLNLFAAERANVPYIGQLLASLEQDFQSGGSPRLLQQPDDMYLISSQLASKLRLESRTVFEALQTCENLFAQLGIKGNCYLIQGEISTSNLSEVCQSTRSENSDFEIHLCADKEKIIGLFTALTADSFLHLTCGHLMMKYDLLDTIATQAGSFSFDVPSLIRLQTKCLACRKPLQTEDINQIFYPRPVQQIRGNCELCWGNLEQTDGCAKCGLRVCANCEVVVSCTTGKPICLRCKGDFLEEMGKKQIVKSYFAWLQRVLDISTKEYSRQKQIEAATAIPEQVPVTIQAAAPSNAPLPGPRPGSTCKNCRKPVQGRPVMCPNQCHCSSCELQYFYFDFRPTMKCYRCKSDLEVERLGTKQCRGCNGSFAYKDLFCFCVACGVASCPACAQGALKEAMKKCSVTKKKHAFSETKRRILGSEECEIW